MYSFAIIGEEYMQIRLNKFKSCMIEYFINQDNWKYILKRIIYIVCLVILCQVDQIAGSGTYETILGTKNRTLLVIGIIILTSNDFKDFIKLPYLIWIIVYGLYVLVSFEGWKEVVEVEALLRTNLWVAGLYGILLIRIVYKFSVERKKPQVRWIPFIVCMVILLGMVFIRTDYDWPKAILMICVFLFLTDFKEKDLNNLYCGILDGIIVGFFVIQIQAWMYRPYDDVRYVGMYTHPNLNALFYLCAYCAVLGKWYLLKLKQKNVLFRIPFILLAGLIIGTMFYTGGRASFIAAVIMTFAFLVFQSISRKKWKILEFMLDGFVIVASIGMCILPAFWLIRYIPMYVREPLYFVADEISGLDKKINKFDQNDSPKYIEFDEAIPEMFDRYLWFLDESTAEALEAFIRDFPQSLITSMEVYAADSIEITKGYIYPNKWDGVDKNVKEYINPRSGLINNAESEYRVSNPIFIKDVSYTIISSNVELHSNVGWRFLDYGGEIVAYGGYVNDEKEQIFLIPENASYFQFTWKPSIHTNFNVEFTNRRPEYINVEVVEPGSDKNHPLVLKGNKGEGAYDSRIDIYRYFMGKLKWVGEENNVQGVWINRWFFASHCHNVFLQFAYDFGIIVGVIFILFILISYITALIGLIKRRTGQNYFRLFVCVGYTTLFVVFGMLEIDWAYGQLPFTLFWLVQYVIVHKEPEKIKSVKNNAPVQLEPIVEGDGIQVIDLDNDDL